MRKANKVIQATQATQAFKEPVCGSEAVEGVAGGQELAFKPRGLTPEDTFPSGSTHKEIHLHLRILSAPLPDL